MDATGDNVMGEHKQNDFTGGLNRLEDASKIGLNEYFFLSNGRVRNGGIEPIKLPKKLKFGLPIDTPFVDDPAPPAPIDTDFDTTIVPPAYPDYPPRPADWPPTTPAFPTIWPVGLAAPVEVTPPIPPAAPPIGCTTTYKTFAWTSPWSVAGTNAKYPDSSIEASDPNTAIASNIQEWWKSHLVSEFVVWAIANNINYSELGFVWTWNSDLTGGDVKDLFDNNEVSAFSDEGWQLNVAYCETPGVEDFYGRINYYNLNAAVEGACKDTVTSVVFFPLTESGGQPVVITATQGAVTGDVGAGQTKNLLVLNFDQAYLDNAVADESTAYVITVTHRSGVSCETESEYTFSVTHATLVGLLVAQIGITHTGLVDDQCEITYNVS